VGLCGLLLQQSDRLNRFSVCLCVRKKCTGLFFRDFFLLCVVAAPVRKEQRSLTASVMLLAASPAQQRRRLALHLLRIGIPSSLCHPGTPPPPPHSHFLLLRLTCKCQCQCSRAAADSACLCRLLLLDLKQTFHPTNKRTPWNCQSHCAIEQSLTHLSDSFHTFGRQFLTAHSSAPAHQT